MKTDRIKKQIYTHIPVYSGDVSGAASALYEFDGMTVIHDPSGCNSTYNTHDELRWSTKESYIFISGLRESDAVRGNDNRLIEDTVYAAEHLRKRPHFIALCNSPVPDITGTDFTAIARIIEERTGIPTFHIKTNAMHDYTAGASNAFYAIAEKFLSSCPDIVPSKKVVLLGLTPFEYPDNTAVDRLTDMLMQNSFEVVSDWGLGSRYRPVTFADITNANNAEVSLVLSSTGIRAAEYLYTMYKIPYVIADPLVSDEYAVKVLDMMRKAIVTHKPYIAYADILNENSGNDAAFIGEPVTMGSEACAYVMSHPGKKVRLICTTETTDHVICEETLCPRGEAAIAEAMMPCAEIYGDPLLKHAMSGGRHGFIPDRQTWIEKPHLAMSGRIYLSYFRDNLENDEFEVIS